MKFTSVIYNMIVFALFSGLLKMSDHIVIVSEEYEIFKDPLQAFIWLAIYSSLL